MLKGCVLTLALLHIVVPGTALSASAFDLTEAEEELCNLQSYRAWFRMEYLLWHLRAAPLPSALVTTGDAFNLGAIGAPDTAILYGGSQDYGWRSGGRLAAGLWLDCDDHVGVEGSFFLLSAHSASANIAAPAGSVLSLPFFSVADSSPTPSVFSLAPGDQAGSTTIESSVRFGGGNLDFVIVPYRSPFCEFQILAGFTSLYLKEELTQDSSSSSVSVSSDAGTTTTTTVTGQTRDSFSTQNIFYGGDLGVRGILRFRPFLLEATGRLAIGGNHQIVNITGQSNTTVTDVSVGAAPGTSSASTNSNTGFLAQASNIGNYSRNTWCFSPQFQVRVAMDLTANIRLSIGYDILYLSSVVRPGNQIDQLIGSANGITYPVFPFNTSGFLAHGMNAGLEFRF